MKFNSMHMCISQKLQTNSRDVSIRIQKLKKILFCDRVPHNQLFEFPRYSVAPLTSGWVEP